LKAVVALAIAGFFGGALQAATVISCSGVATSSNSCYANSLPSFTTRLDWAVFGAPDGVLHQGVWTANNVAGYDISVSSQNSAGLRVADNFASVLVNGNWILAGFIPTSPYAFAGHFDAPPDTAQTSAIPPGNPYGDHLLGVATNANQANAKLVIDFSVALSDVALRIASTTASGFDARMQLFSGLDGTGILLGDNTYTGLTGGGNCATLSVSVSNPPSPCNDAPLIGMAGFNDLVVKSIVLSTSDPDGFFISSLMVNSAPEPASMILCGGGVLLLLLRKKRPSSI
jgi:hypothetical protein